MLLLMHGKAGLPLLIPVGDGSSHLFSLLSFFIYFREVEKTITDVTSKYLHGEAIE